MNKIISIITAIKERKQVGVIENHGGRGWFTFD